MPEGIYCFIDISGGELLVIVIAFLIIVGPKKIPEVARIIGKIISEAKNAASGLKNEIDLDKNSFDFHDNTSENTEEHPDSNEKNSTKQ